MNPRWQVSFKGKLNKDAKDLLAAIGVFLVASRLRLGPDGTEEPRGATVWVRAADADAAIEQIKAALVDYGHFQQFTATPVSFIMYLGFLESERDALETVTQQVGQEDPRVSMVVIHDPSKGSAELLLEIPALDKDAAVAQALAVYKDLRERAGLEPEEPLYGFLGATGYFPTLPIEPPPRHAELAQRAQDLFERGDYDYSIVAAQTACERLAFDSITTLLNAQSDSPSASFARHWFDKGSKTQSLADDRLQQLWTSLTGDTVQGQAWWDSYSKHIGRRHGIVHRGSEPTREQAAESLKATEAFRKHIAAAATAALDQSGNNDAS